MYIIPKSFLDNYGSFMIIIVLSLGGDEDG
jgi:hypothetical protein